MPEIINTIEAAEILGVSLSTTIRRARSGEIPTAGKLPGATGSYLFSRADIEAISNRKRETS